MKNWQYWIKGGLLAIPASIIIIPLTLFITRLLSAGQEIIWFLAPEFAVAAFGLGMRGTPPAMSEVLSTLIIVGGIFIVRSFIIGAVLGAIYGIFANRNIRKIFFIGLLILYALGIGFLSHKTKDVSVAYNLVNNPEDCLSSSNKGIDNFDVNHCYQALALKNQDLTICDNIKTESIFEKAPEDFKAFCYEEVIYAKNDSSLCSLISPETYNDYNVATGRRDSCYDRFKLCEKISDANSRDSCYMSKAEYFNDTSACTMVSANNVDECYTRAGSTNKNISLCQKIKDQDKKQTCFDGVYYNRARDEHNATLCDQVKDPQEKESCHSNLSQQ